MMTNLFNTPFETALRILLLLETEARKDFSANMIAAIDFAALYGKSFGISDTNLHGDNLFKFSEFGTRKELTGEGIKFLVCRGLINVEATQKGFIYKVSNHGKQFAESLNTRYANDYRKQVSLALKYYSHDSEPMIVKKINKVALASLEKETAEFHEE